VGKDVYELRIDTSEAPERLGLVVRAEAGGEWTYSEPGWQPLSYGFVNGAFLICSARRVIIHRGPQVEPELIETDNDPLCYVFSAPAGWLLVCEISVRLMARAREVARLGLHDVVVTATFDDPTLYLSLFDGTKARIRVTGPTLQFEP